MQLCLPRLSFSADPPRSRYEDVSRWANVAWHSDVSFEKVPSDYSMLKINILPPSGGDTHWINCYDVSTLRARSRSRSLPSYRCLTRPPFDPVACL